MPRHRFVDQAAWAYPTLLHDVGHGILVAEEEVGVQSAAEPNEEGVRYHGNSDLAGFGIRQLGDGSHSAMGCLPLHTAPCRALMR